MSKKGLGRGLGALIPEIEVASRESITEIDINLVQANPRQPRRTFDPAKLEELAASIREHGVVQPIVVRPKENGYEIVAGERRWRAAQMAGLIKIPALVRPFSEAETMEIALIENLQREDLNPLEEANAYRVLLEEFHQTQEQLGKRLGKSRPQISNTLRLLQLCREVQEEIRAGRLSMGHAKVLLGVSDQRLQAALAMKVASEGLSVRELERMLKRLESEPEGRKGDPKAGDRGWREVENQLREWFGTPVKLVSGEKKGRIEITFFGEEGLNRILEALGVQTQSSVNLAEKAPKAKFHV